MQNGIMLSPTHTQNARVSLYTPACPVPSSCVAGMHSTTRTCAVLVFVATTIPIFSVAAVPLLLVFFAEIV